MCQDSEAEVSQASTALESTVELRELAEHRCKLRVNLSGTHFDWYQSVLELSYLCLIESLVTSLIEAVGKTSETKPSMEMVLSRFQEIVESARTQSPRCVLDRIISASRRVEALPQDPPQSFDRQSQLERNSSPSLLDLDAMKIGTIYGPVGHVEQEEDSDPRLVLYSQRWKEIQDRINDAITNRKGYVGPDRKIVSANDLGMLSTVLDRMTNGELSFSQDQAGAALGPKEIESDFPPQPTY